MKVQRGVIHRARRRAPLFGEYSENRTCCAGRLGTDDGQTDVNQPVHSSYICRSTSRSTFITCIITPLASYVGNKNFLFRILNLGIYM